MVRNKICIYVLIILLAFTFDVHVDTKMYNIICENLYGKVIFKGKGYDLKQFYVNWYFKNEKREEVHIRGFCSKKEIKGKK